MESEPLVYFLLLLIGTLFLYFLPFLPAILEWKNKTDAAPPNVNFQDKTIVDYQIRIFKEYIEKNFIPLIEKYKNMDSAYEGKMLNGSEYIIIGQNASIPLSNQELTDKKIQKNIIFCQNGKLPGNVTFTNRIYSTESIEVGTMSTIKELMTEKNIVLNDWVSVNTLIYAGDTITINENCNLNKYARAKNKIQFLGQAEFQYLYAPDIAFGDVNVKLPKNTIDVLSINIPRKIFLEKYDIPQNSHLTNHLVVKGPLAIHSGCEIKGNIKCHQDMWIERNTTIIGAIICNKDIMIADNCVIQGPIVSLGTIRIGNNCVIGSGGILTSIIAGNIIISNGCLISGLVLAKIKGFFQGKID